MILQNDLHFHNMNHNSSPAAVATDTATATATDTATPSSLAMQSLVSFLEAYDTNPATRTHTSSATGTVTVTGSGIYDQFANTPTRKRNHIINQRTQTIAALDKIASTSADKKQAHDAKFVSLLVELISEGGTGTGTGTSTLRPNSTELDRLEEQEGIDSNNDHDHDNDNDDPIERLDGIRHILSMLATSSFLETSTFMHANGKDDLKSILADMTLEQLCHLPSTLLQREQELSRNDNQIQMHAFASTPHTKRRRMNSYKNKSKSASSSTQIINHASLKRVYAILGYIITHVLLQETCGVIQFQAFGEYILEKIIVSRFVAKSMHSIEHAAFQSGFISYMLDCMIQSTDVWDGDGGFDVAAASAEFCHNHEQGDDAVRNCWIRNDLWIEGLHVEAVVNFLHRDR